MSTNKRKADDSTSQALVVKKTKTEEGALIVSNKEDKGKQLIISGVKRTSELHAPIMLLEGHEGEIYTTKFNPSGTTIASGSFDKTILLWNVYGECINYGVLKGHVNAVLDLQWSTDGANILSSSADKTLIYWDAESGERIKRLRAHNAIVNSCGFARRGPPLIVSGSDDCTTKLWDMRVRAPIASLACKYPVTSVTFNDTAEQVMTAGIDNVVKVWDIRKLTSADNSNGNTSSDSETEILYTLEGHSDTITGIRLSPDGSHLLTNAMDNTMRIWDVRPYVKGGDEARCVKIFDQGIRHNVDKNLLRCSWSPDGSMVSGGSSDSPTHVYIYSVATRQILFKLPGHKGPVNEVEFHPTEPIVASCSSDKKIYLGEIDPSL